MPDAIYDPSAYPPFAVTADLVVLTIREERLQALLVRRGGDPYVGAWALPGGFVGVDESILDAASRELAEETGLPVGTVHLEQLATYGDPGRDPRMRVVSVAHLALAPDLPTPHGGTDAAEARWWPLEDLGDLPLAFDHARILADGVERARAKLEYTPLGAAFCGETFTVAELRRVYEVVWGIPLDARNFHRKVTGTPGFLEATGTTTTRDGGRPAAVFRAGVTARLHPPLTRS